MARKRRHEPEYTLHVFRQADERTRKTSVVLLLRTVKEFTNFNYHILVDTSVTADSIELKILGLQTSSLIMPGVGPAVGQKSFSNLDGVYRLTVTKLDGESNQFRLRITPDRVLIEESPPRPFVLVSNEPIHISQE